MDEQNNVRKLEHLSVLEEDSRVDRGKDYFADIRLTHRALPELDRSAIDTSVDFMGKRLALPLLIPAMTGGDSDVARTVNHNLALAAEAAGVAMGVGSQRVMFSHPQARASFELRQHAPNALLFANLGAVQLNYGFTVDHCREAVEAVGADALCLHLNPLQEAVQPEGNVNFAGLAEKIGAVAQALEVPVILKEVGAGISPEDVELIVDQGVRYIDVAGAGGTSWSRIEYLRQARHQPADDLGLAFQDWGIPTPLALERLRPWRDRVTLIASGGIRDGAAMAKAIILGASLCGVAAPFLAPAKESPESVVSAIEDLERVFRTTMFLLGVADVASLHCSESLLL